MMVQARSLLRKYQSHAVMGPLEEMPAKTRTVTTIQDITSSPESDRSQVGRGEKKGRDDIRNLFSDPPVVSERPAAAAGSSSTQDPATDCPPGTDR